MSNREKIYMCLCIAFAMLITLGNLIYQKFVMLAFPFHKFELSVGAILYPLTFLITDLITEFYGKERAQFCIKITLFLNIFVATLLMFMDTLPATVWSKISNETFHAVFGYFGVAFAASLLACFISQAIDIRLYLFMRRITKGRHLWLRSNLSTCVSLLIDTIVVIGFMTIFGIFPVKQMSSLIINSYSWKLMFTIFSTPLFYIAVLSFKPYIRQEECADINS